MRLNVSYCRGTTVRILMYIFPSNINAKFYLLIDPGGLLIYPIDSVLVIFSSQFMFSFFGTSLLCSLKSNNTIEFIQTVVNNQNHYSIS